jgi:hypothetical protein
MVAFVVRNMATHHFTILNSVAQIYVAPQCCNAFFAAVVCVICLFSFCLTFLYARAPCPAALPLSSHRHTLVNVPLLLLLLLCQLLPVQDCTDNFLGGAHHLQLPVYLNFSPNQMPINSIHVAQMSRMSCCPIPNRCSLLAQAVHQFLYRLAH